jgi:hypothetical protein
VRHFSGVDRHASEKGRKPPRQQDRADEVARGSGDELRNFEPDPDNIVAFDDVRRG